MRVCLAAHVTNGKDTDVIQRDGRKARAIVRVDYIIKNRLNEYLSYIMCECK